MQIFYYSQNKKMSSTTPADSVFDQSPPSPTENSLIEKLKLKLIQSNNLLKPGPEASSIWGLLRFIRGHGTVEAAYDAYIQGIAWREKLKATEEVRSLLKMPNEDSQTEEEIFNFYTNLSRLQHWYKVAPGYPERFFHGRDSHGNPVMITRHDMIDNVFGLMTLCTSSEYDEFRVARAINLELLLDALSRRRNKLIKVIYIWDLNHMTRKLYQSWSEPVVKQFWGDFDNESSIAFPESTYRAIGINVPSWLMILWNGIKLVLPARTLKKVAVFGTGNNAAALVKKCELPMEIIPADLGGSTPPELTMAWFRRPVGFTWKEEETITLSPGMKHTYTMSCPLAGWVTFSAWISGKPGSGKNVDVTPTRPSSLPVVTIDSGSFYSLRTNWMSVKPNDVFELILEINKSASASGGIFSSFSSGNVQVDLGIWYRVE
jgi:hypothetical protein